MQPMTPEEVASRLTEVRRKNGSVTPAQNREFTERRRAAELNRDLNEDGLNMEDLK